MVLRSANGFHNTGKRLRVYILWVKKHLCRLLSVSSLIIPWFLIISSLLHSAVNLQYSDHYKDPTTPKTRLYTTLWRYGYCLHGWFSWFSRL